MCASRIIDGVAWTVREGLEEEVLAGLLPKLDRAGDNPAFVPIKDNTVRTAFLYATGCPARPFIFIKRYKCRTLADTIKYLLVPSKAVSEWKTLHRFERMQLSCPRPLALYERRTGGRLQDSILVTEALNGAVALNELAGRLRAAPREDAGLSRLELARQLAGCVRTLHARRVYYRDLHAGNILIDPHGDRGKPALFFIDLHRAWHVPRLWQWMRTQDLAQLCNSLPVFRTDKIRFLTEYARGVSPEQLRTLGQRVDARARALRARRIISRSKRCVKQSSIFEIRSTWSSRACARRDFGFDAARAVIARHRETGDQAGNAHTLKASSKSTLTAHTSEGKAPVCVKQYRNLGVLYALKNIFARSRAMKSWRAANGLLVRGIPTPLPLALVEKRRGPLVLESFFITRWLDRACELNGYVSMLADAPRTKKNAFISALAQLIRRLHAAGVYHADLKSNNIMVCERGEHCWEFHLVDLDRVHFRRHIPFALRANNLAQINASVSAVMTPKDRLKFFRFYAKGTTHFQSRKTYYRTILHISRKKVTGPYGVIFS